MDLGPFQRAASATEWILSDARKARGERWLCGLRPSSLRLVPLVPWAPFRSRRSALRCLAFGSPLATDRHEKARRARPGFLKRSMGLCALGCGEFHRQALEFLGREEHAAVGSARRMRPSFDYGALEFFGAEPEQRSCTLYGDHGRMLRSTTARVRHDKPTARRSRGSMLGTGSR